MGRYLWIVGVFEDQVCHSNCDPMSCISNLKEAPSQLVSACHVGFFVSNAEKTQNHQRGAPKVYQSWWGSHIDTLNFRLCEPKVNRQSFTNHQFPKMLDHFGVMKPYIHHHPQFGLGRPPGSKPHCTQWRKNAALHAKVLQSDGPKCNLNAVWKTWINEDVHHQIGGETDVVMGEMRSVESTH